ncbi:hypothetical protein GALL_420130 [mine drainage metagenome]|uniref:Uncharacterized protein n=1 Tax=mine drainage metagenome TaxID=410659 RepID=A0A1J5Q8G0_9ZZZZ
MVRGKQSLLNRGGGLGQIAGNPVQRVCGGLIVEVRQSRRIAAPLYAAQPAKTAFRVKHSGAGPGLAGDHDLRRRRLAQQSGNTARLGIRDPVGERLQETGLGDQNRLGKLPCRGVAH